MWGTGSSNTTSIMDTLAVAAAAATSRHRADDTDLSFYSGRPPRLSYNATMIAIWGVLLIIHSGQLYWRQYWFSVAFICTAILEVLGYIGRVWSSFNEFSENGYLLQFICLTIAPVFTTGGMYYQVAKLIEVYGHRFSLLPSPMIYSYFFIVCDIVSLVVQAAGGGVAGVALSEDRSTERGTHIFVGGLALQVASLSIFLLLWADFAYRIYVQCRFEYSKSHGLPKSKFFHITQLELEPHYRAKFHFLRADPDRWVFKYFILAFTVAICCIFARCAYRLAELVQGFTGFIITHEWYFIALDGIMMSLATTIMTVFHPGFAFMGNTTAIPITHGRIDPEDVADQESATETTSNSNNDQEKDSESDPASSNKIPWFKRLYKHTQN